MVAAAAAGHSDLVVWVATSTKFEARGRREVLEEAARRGA